MGIYWKSRILIDLDGWFVGASAYDGRTVPKNLFKTTINTNMFIAAKN